jgi:hypothetical protein
MRRNAMTALIAFLAVTCLAPGANSTEWRSWPTPKDSPFVGAGFKHDDGGSFVVLCDTKARLMSILIVEPRAKWQSGATMNVITRADDGTESNPASAAVVIGATQIVIKERSTFDLFTAGKAKTFFATGVGGYARIWPVVNFKKATDSVLKACGDHW